MGHRALQATGFAVAALLCLAVRGEETPRPADTGLSAKGDLATTDAKSLLPEIPDIDTDAPNCPAFKFTWVVDVPGGGLKVNVWHRDRKIARRASDRCDGHSAVPQRRENRSLELGKLTAILLKQFLQFAEHRLVLR